MAPRRAVAVIKESSYAADAIVASFVATLAKSTGPLTSGAIRTLSESLPPPLLPPQPIAAMSTAQGKSGMNVTVSLTWIVGSALARNYDAHHPVRTHTWPPERVWAHITAALYKELLFVIPQDEYASADSLLSEHDTLHPLTLMDAVIDLYPEHHGALCLRMATTISTIIEGIKSAVTREISEQIAVYAHALVEEYASCLEAL